MNEGHADVVFRRAETRDVNAIADAHRDSIRSLGAAHYSLEVVEAWAAAVSPELYLHAMDGGEVFFVAVAKQGDQPLVLGFSSDYRITGTTHGTSAYVRGSAARRGIGSRLLALAQAFGIARGATEVQIEASRGAVEFYRANGFVETGTGDVTLPSGFRMPCVFMRKDLRP